MIRKTRVHSLVQLDRQCVVVLEEEDGPRLLPIWIGLFEASAIAAKLSGQEPPRPMTHDLMAEMIRMLSAQVEKVVITDLRDNTFFATVTITRNGSSLEVDSRPSDAMALAVRVDCPIYVDERVFRKCPEMLKPISKEEAEKLKQELQTLTPEDFFKNLKEHGGPPEADERTEEPPPGPGEPE